MESQQQPHIELRERFYQSVAETMTLLHSSPGYDRRLALLEVARILAVTMDLPLVWIGRRDLGHSRLEITPAGPASGYAASLQLSDDEREPGGRGPVGAVLREGRARITAIDAPEFEPWRAAARIYGFGSCIVAASGTHDGGQLVLAAYFRPNGPALMDELLDWAQRLVDELARFWDDQALLERNLRLSRYRDAQRAIQQAMLHQPDPEAIYLTLARTLVEVAGAAAVDVLAVQGDTLLRVALAGPLADAMGMLSPAPTHADGDLILTSTLTFMQGTPVVRIQPSTHAEMSPLWRTAPLAQMGAIGCWPIFSTLAGEITPGRVPVAVFCLVTEELEAFDEDMRRLLDEIAEAATLALRQHKHRDALFHEQERQTFLALHDALTDLPNRRALDYHLERALVRAQRHRHLVAVGMLDLDDLKPINDRHGHEAGDRVLVEVAARLREALRSEDYVARLGGDEFVLVFEDVANADDIDLLLDRVWQALQRPMDIDGTTIRLGASLGIAMYPIHAAASGEQLLRSADQAMYQVKAHKRDRTRWWALALPEGATGPSTEHHAAAASPYGERAAAQLGHRLETWDAQLDDAVERFFAELVVQEGTANILGVLPPPDVENAKTHLARHLRMLLDPQLDLPGHRARARRSGLFHSACGLEEVSLLEGIERLRDILATTLRVGTHADQRALTILLQRLGMERQWQLESMRELQRRRVALIARLNALAWSADGYLELIQGVVDILVAHEEIIACTVGRPALSGEMTYEAVAGAAFTEYLRALAAGGARPVGVEEGNPEGGGPTGRAWRTAQIQRCPHYGTDPAMSIWREIATQIGVISNVAIPLCSLPGKPVAVLTIYSPYPGGFQSEDQQAFAEQIRTVLDLALARIAPPRLGAELLPFFVRERWRSLIRTHAVEMHFQPMLRLADRQVTELEALARLRDDDGTLLAPAKFLPALSNADLAVLFREGLEQATRCRQTLVKAGHVLDVSVNAPAVALEDPRYAEIASTVLAASSCPVEALLLEILESPIGTEHAPHGTEVGMQSMKALGVRLVEDDLGAGYSSLIRLRQWPFDRVKIDQAIVRQATRDPQGTLRFIRQLIRIGHDLGMEVVVEGLESPGMVEAAKILGADFGQGYALGRPMPPEELPNWLARFRSSASGGARQPLTGLGALAGALRWEEQFIALPADRRFWSAYAKARCVSCEYLQDSEKASPALITSHQGMHTAAEDGPLDPTYRLQRQEFLSLLIENVLTEEAGGNLGDPGTP
jgi:diguanylate cyclase (GGDEF)-like protein